MYLGRTDIERLYRESLLMCHRDGSFDSKEIL